jgi:putative chitinase
VLDIKDWSTETQAKDKILFAGAATSTDKIVAIEASNSAISDVKSYLKVFNFDKSMLKNIFPGASVSKREKYFPHLEKYFEILDITSCKKINHFFAQVDGEVLQFHYNKEVIDVRSKEVIENSVFCTNSTKNSYRKYACSHPSEFVNKPHKFANYVYGTMLGNSIPIEGDDLKGEGDGWKYRGRGAHQLTGYDNYKAFNDAIPNYIKDKKFDILKSPDEVSDNEELYILSAIWHWDSHGGNDAAESNSCDCCECKAIDPDPNCVGKVTKTVNGGCNNAKHRNDAFNRILKKNPCN